MDQKLPSESDSGILCDEQYNTGNRKTAAGKAATYPHFIRRKIHTVRSRLILPVRHAGGSCKKNTPAETQG
ncbi:MAG TPA: hypothetical protein DHV79_06310 [Lachnospiraceae bacterium]|nr:hypothetical protein [Lachnospiraceae bacterium]